MSETELPVLVLGAGVAGVRAAEGLRRGGYAGPLTLLDADGDAPYARPTLSKEVLLDGGRRPAEAVAALPLPAVLSDVGWRSGEQAEVVTVDVGDRVVRVRDGSVLAWRALVLAPGVVAATLPTLPGAEPALTLRSLADAREVAARLQPGSSLVVVGAGFLACELALAALALGVEVRLLAPEPIPLLGVLGQPVAGLVAEALAAAGVQLEMGLAVSSASDRQAVLTDGSSRVADTVVLAIGSRPCSPPIHPALPAGNPLARGLVGNSHFRLETADGPRPDLVVAGDAAALPIRSGGVTTRTRVEHWTWAHDTGRAAGRALAAWLAGEQPTTASVDLLPSFWSDLHLPATGATAPTAVTIQSLGMPNLGSADIRVLEGSADGCLRDCRVVLGAFLEDALVGVVMLGLGRRARHYRSVLTGEARGAGR